MQIVRASALLFSLSLLACGDDGGTHHLIDSGIGNSDTTPKVCTSVSPGAGDIDTEVLGSYITFASDLNEMVGGNGAAIFSEFYHSMSSPSLTGTHDLSMGADADYATCLTCFLAASGPNGGPYKYYFQQSGTVTYTEDPITARRLNLTVSDVKLQEATVDFANTFMSTFVPTGDCLTLSGTFMEDHVPNEWATTCAATDYYQGTPTANCDCSCGAYDPDCKAPAAGDRTTGCTTAGTPACWPDENVGSICVARPANDTCGAPATTLTVGAAATNGTTVGASADYTQPRGTTNTCTTKSQGGPDVVYKVTLTAATAYTFTLTNTDQLFDPSMTIVGPYASATECVASNATCAAGRDTGLRGEGETASYTPTASGIYYVIVDTQYRTPFYNVDPANAVNIGGAFTIRVTSP